MNLEQVSEHLNLLGSSNRKETFDILFNLGHIYKEFKELLAITHVSSNRRALLKAKENGSVKMESVRPMSIAPRVQRAINGREAQFNSFEYHIVYTLVESLRITPAIRVSLQESLAYTVSIPEDKPFEVCAICSYVGSKSLCLSCKRNLLDFTVARRESFIVPINYLNFNIRGAINHDGELSIRYNDWSICKHGTSISYTLLPDLTEGAEPIQYDLPFVENQKTIT